MEVLYFGNTAPREQDISYRVEMHLGRKFSMQEVYRTVIKNDGKETRETKNNVCLYGVKPYVAMRFRDNQKTASVDVHIKTINAIPELGGTCSIPKSQTNKVYTIIILMRYNAVRLVDWENFNELVACGPSITRGIFLPVADVIVQNQKIFIIGDCGCNPTGDVKIIKPEPGTKPTDQIAKFSQYAKTLRGRYFMKEMSFLNKIQYQEMYNAPSFQSVFGMPPSPPSSAQPSQSSRKEED